jgi:hypothetical protein
MAIFLKQGMAAFDDHNVIDRSGYMHTQGPKGCRDDLPVVSFPSEHRHGTEKYLRGMRIHGNRPREGLWCAIVDALFVIDWMRVSPFTQPPLLRLFQGGLLSCYQQDGKVFSFKNWPQLQASLASLSSGEDKSNGSCL